MHQFLSALGSEPLPGAVNTPAHPLCRTGGGEGSGGQEKPEVEPASADVTRSQSVGQGTGKAYFPYGVQSISGAKEIGRRLSLPLRSISGFLSVKWEDQSPPFPCKGCGKIRWLDRALESKY